MKKFAFRLERVLDLRKQEEEREKQRLGVLLRKLQAAGRTLLACQAELAELEERFGRAIDPAINGNELDIHQVGLYRVRQELLLRRLAAARAEVAGWQQRVDEQRAVLLVAARRREVLARLREREREEFRKEAVREEQKILDEVASVWHYRQTGQLDV